MFILFSALTNSLSDDDFVVTKDLVRAINNDPKSTFKAVYYPKFGSMRLRDFKRFLSPVRKAPESHGSARPVGYPETEFYHSDKRMFTGIRKEVTQAGNDFNINYTVQYPKFSSANSLEVPFPVFDNTKLCSSWATAVTSAMSTTLTRWSEPSRFINLSVQFLLDCDIMGDACVERPPLSAYEQFWRRYIPTNDKWDEPDDPLRAPSQQLTQEMCNNYRSCYPGMNSCKREIVMTGVCELGTQQYGTCPIYFLYNWRWIKSHLAEVGAVTSSILVRPGLFTYADGVYSSWGQYSQEKKDANWGDAPAVTENQDIRSVVLGMLDVTIIGWGQTMINLTQDQEMHKQMKQRWWYVIPHLGTDYGLKCKDLLADLPKLQDKEDVPDAYKTFIDDGITANTQIKDAKSIDSSYDSIKFVFNSQTICDTNEDSDIRTGVIKFNRRFDDSNIESHAVGAVPYNFIPKPWRTPQPTWKKYVAPAK